MNIILPIALILAGVAFIWPERDDAVTRKVIAVIAGIALIVAGILSLVV